MLKPEQLLRLYPRAWRERYGNEFLDTVGDSPLRAQQVIDIVMGAIDARMSAAVRRSTAPAVAANDGGRVMTILKASCARPQRRMTTTDGLISAAVMIGGTVLFVVIGIALDRAGNETWGDALKGIGFPAAMMISMPFGLVKGQPWRAQAILIGVTLAILGGFTYLSTLI